MPAPENIIEGLQQIVNQYNTFAVATHVLFYLIIIALIFRWKPSNRLFIMILGLPLLTVAVFAWLSMNPFNGTLFSLLVVLLVFFGLRTPDVPVQRSPLIFSLSGIIMITFGLAYPHFIEAGTPLKYLFDSPAGLIPCPSLSIAIGFALLFNGFISQQISLILSLFGLFYGAFGVLKLNVKIDFFLIFGTTMLLIKVIPEFKNYLRPKHGAI